MAKDKERSVNPAAAARKAEKDKAKKKGKAAVQAQRTERLSRQNPARLERQIADLRLQEQSGKSLSTRDKRQLEELERDVGRIHKAREAAGEKPFRSEGQGVKRRWDERDGGGRGRERQEGRGRERHAESSGEETDESVRRIPMPGDTPPPVPRRRREWVDRGRGGGEGQETGQKREQVLVPVVENRTVYEAKAVVKDLRKEAVGFVPSAVRKKIDATKGTGGKLLEAEELDRLEGQGYGTKTAPSTSTHVQMEDVPDEDL